VARGVSAWVAITVPGAVDGGIKERVDADHVDGHVVRPFQDLRVNAGQEESESERPMIMMIMILLAIE
jgi:hypothetical protein